MAYIKDSAIACLEKMFCELRENSDKISRIKAVFLRNYVIPTLEASKTDDATEVKHGVLEANLIKPWNGQVVNWKCSVCGGIISMYSNYCPHCGVKMD